VLPVLIALIGFQRTGWRGIAAATVAVAIFAGIAWSTSLYIRVRSHSALNEVQNYLNTNAETSLGLRLEFWKKSVGFIADAPIFGHGTGSTSNLFRRAAVGEGGASAVVSNQPHNQTLVVAIQLGFVGVALLWTMWIAHFLMFRGNGLVPWLGVGLVAQNIVSSLANSHLTDFAPGWLYVLGVGVLGGITLRNQAAPAPTVQV
jgi:O-antigen ligase